MTPGASCILIFFFSFLLSKIKFIKHEIFFGREKPEDMLKVFINDDKFKSRKQHQKLSRAVLQPHVSQHGHQSLHPISQNPARNGNIQFNKRNV